MVDNKRKDFMVMAPHRCGQGPAWFSRLRRADSSAGRSNHLFHMDCRMVETPAELLNRMNSAFMRYPLSSKKRLRGVATRVFCNGIVYGTQQKTLGEGAGRVADDQFRSDLAMAGTGVAFLQNGVDSINDDADGRGTHRFHGLANRGERGRVDGGGSYVIETDDGALVRNAY